MLQDHVAANVRAELGRRDRTQDELARQLGWSPAFLNRRLKGHVDFSREEIREIADALDVPISVLIPQLSSRKAG